jgi:hypothetical protein
MKIGLTSKRSGSNIHTYYKYIHCAVSKFIASVTADVFENDGKRSLAHAQCFPFLQTCLFATTQQFGYYSIMFLNMVTDFLTGKQQKEVHKEASCIHC